MTFHKIYIIVIILTIGGLISCGRSTSTTKNNPSVVDSSNSENIQKDSVLADKYAVVYKFDSTYKDSNTVYKLWYLNDSLIKKSGNFYYPIPFESEFVTDYIISNSGGKTIYETFDSLVCEVGGKSAWNKYLFKYDENKKPKEIRHFKAWWNEGLGDDDRPTKPEYFLGETIKFEYRGTTTIQRTYDESKKLIETITKTYDSKNRLLTESWDAWNEYRYKTYYTYK